jgi:hypothetical protein
MSNRLEIEACLLRSRVKNIQGVLSTKVEAVMFETRKEGSGLFCLTEDEKFQIAVVTLITILEGEEKERILHEFKMLKSLGAAIDGVPVDLASLSEESERMRFEPVGLIKIWNETKGS